MSLNLIHDEFQQSAQHVRHQWQQTVYVWDDQVRWQFEGDFWQPLNMQLIATSQAMEALAQVISQARQQVP